MSQEQGIFGTVKNYIPGLSTPEREAAADGQSTAHTTEPSGQQPGQNTGGGILSYIPGFGGNTGTADNQDSTDVNAPRTTRSGTVYGNTDAGEGGGTGLGGAKTTTDGDINNTHTHVPGSGGVGREEAPTGIAHTGHTGERPQRAEHERQDTGYGGDRPPQETYKPQQGVERTPPADSGAYGTSAAGTELGGAGGGTAAGQVNNPGFDGNTGGVRQESDVKGAPIEGENVQGYAVSAPVGSGDVNERANTGDPSGQVSGAHMQYGPVDTDDRDYSGRGTVGRTHGEGDSSFANIKRDIPHGTEHVTTHQSQSRVSYSSTTQM